MTTLLETTSFGYKFETSNGCTFTRERLRPTGIAYELNGWSHTRELYELTEHDRKLFPKATHRISLTSHRDQSDPMFVCSPCWIKEGTKHQLLYIGDDDVVSQVRIKTVYDWT
jgi:hypothetical protein